MWQLGSHALCRHSICWTLDAFRLGYHHKLPESLAWEKCLLACNLFWFDSNSISSQGGRLSRTILAFSCPTKQILGCLLVAVFGGFLTRRVTEEPGSWRSGWKTDRTRLCSQTCHPNYASDYKLPDGFSWLVTWARTEITPAVVFVVTIEDRLKDAGWTSAHSSLVSTSVVVVAIRYGKLTGGYLIGSTSPEKCKKVTLRRPSSKSPALYVTNDAKSIQISLVAFNHRDDFAMAAEMTMKASHG